MSELLNVAQVAAILQVSPGTALNPEDLADVILALNATGQPIESYSVLSGKGSA